VRVMMLTPLYIPWVGGLEILVQQLVRDLEGRGHEVMIVTSHGQEAESGLDEVDGVPVLRVPAHSAIQGRDTATVFDIQRTLALAIRDFAPDLVHSHDAGPVLWMYLRAARQRPRPLIVTVHNAMSHAFDGALDLLGGLLERADWVTGVSQDVVDDVLEYAPEVADRISVITNGVEAPTEPVEPVPVDPPRLAAIGRLVPQKGFDRAIDAIAAVAPRIPDLRLAIAGYGPEEAALVEQARERGVADRVEFLGILDRDGVQALLRDSTAVLMPSRYEGLPLVALEAAWAGRPVIATRAPGLDRAVVDGETALVVDPESEAIAAAIERLVADPALARRLGTGARAFAERSFSLAACTDRYEELYTTLAGSPPSPER